MKRTIVPPKNGTPAKPAAPQKATAQQRQASAMRTQAFVQGIFSEMKRVTWPTRDEWVSATILTIVLVVAVGFYTFGVDWIFEKLFGLIRH